ncbi:SPOSA6832_00265, partial [Sporobolomyces salmonicolor]
MSTPFAAANELPSRTSSLSVASPSSTPAPAAAEPLSEADRKRRDRAQKKAEQQARKDERKRIAAETGVDPALLPASLGGGLGNASARPKGFTPRQWGKDRIPPLMQEVLYYAPDIACLQEVDRLSDHLPSLTLTHSYTSFIGYRNKAHGLLIAHANKTFEKVGERGLRLDELPIEDTEAVSTAPSWIATPVPAEAEANGAVGADETPSTESPEEERPPDAASPSLKASRRAAGLSRSTRNVCLFVALKFKDREGGVIVGTTHLFWHPMHVYERVRQTGIFVREAKKFREEGGGGAWRDWPVFLAGDFNTQPEELTYRLLLGAPLPFHLISDLERSTCVHQSVDKLHDPSYEPPMPPEPEAKEGDEATATAKADPSQDPDKVIKNSRPAMEVDGLATLEQLKKLYGYQEGAGSGSGIRSAYGEAYGLVKGEEDKWYCARSPEVQTTNGSKVLPTEKEKEERSRGTWEERVRRGDFEPIYTNFTPLWRCTLEWGDSLHASSLTATDSTSHSYIFLLPPSTNCSSPARPAPRWTSLLKMHDVETMGAGLPRKGIEPSDHVALAATVELF